MVNSKLCWGRRDSVFPLRAADRLAAAAIFQKHLLPQLDTVTLQAVPLSSGTHNKLENTLDHHSHTTMTRIVHRGGGEVGDTAAGNPLDVTPSLLKGPRVWDAKGVAVVQGLEKEISLLDIEIELLQQLNR
jgi:hypothetical protein